MDDAILDKIKKDLMNKKNELLQTIRQQQENMNDSMKANDVPKDSVDSANDDVDKNILQTLSAAESLLLSKIESALVRIGNGTYGKCLNCGNPIAPARLEAMPSAAYCRDCQEKLDKKPVA